MDEQKTARLNQLKDEANAAVSEVEVALESGEDDKELATHARVQDLGRRFADFVATLDEADRAQVERTVGRRITDLRRQAEALTKRVAGTKVDLSVDAGFVPFLERRKPPTSIEPQRNAPTRHSPKFQVGGEVEAWCGKCKDFTNHHVVAMIGDQPKQVICVKCKSRHSYRTEPSARSSGEKTGLPTQTQASASTYRTPVDPEVAKKAEQKRQLIKELDEAQEPRTFDPRARFRANEIIVHPEWGRGKIENVLKGSLLVRFRDGLKPLNMK